MAWDFEPDSGFQRPSSRAARGRAYLRIVAQMNLGARFEALLDETKKRGSTKS